MTSNEQPHPAPLTPPPASQPATKWVIPTDKETLVKAKTIIEKEIEYLNKWMNFYVPVHQDRIFPVIKVDIDQQQNGKWTLEYTLSGVFYVNLNIFMDRFKVFANLNESVGYTLVNSTTLDELVERIAESIIWLGTFCCDHQPSNSIFDFQNLPQEFLEIFEKSNIKFDQAYERLMKKIDAEFENDKRYNYDEELETLINSINAFDSAESLKHPMCSDTNGFHLIEPNEIKIVPAMSISLMLAQYFVQPLAHKGKEKRWEEGNNAVFTMFLTCLSSFGMSLLKNACFNFSTSFNPMSFYDNGVDIPIIGNDALLALYKVLVLAGDADEYRPSTEFSYLKVARFMASMCNLHTKTFGPNIRNILHAVLYHQYECTALSWKNSLSDFKKFMKSINDNIANSDSSNFIQANIRNAFFFTSSENAEDLSNLEKFCNAWELATDAKTSKYCETLAKRTQDVSYKSIFRFVNYNHKRWMTSTFKYQASYVFKDWMNLMTYQNLVISSLPSKSKKEQQRLDTVPVVSRSNLRTTNKQTVSRPGSTRVAKNDSKTAIKIPIVTPLTSGGKRKIYQPKPLVPKTTSMERKPLKPVSRSRVGVSTSDGNSNIIPTITPLENWNISGGEDWNEDESDETPASSVRSVVPSGDVQPVRPGARSPARSFVRPSVRTHVRPPPVVPVVQSRPTYAQKVKSQPVSTKISVATNKNESSTVTGRAQPWFERLSESRARENRFSCVDNLPLSVKEEASLMIEIANASGTARPIRPDMKVKAASKTATSVRNSDATSSDGQVGTNASVASKKPARK
jgi:hypothetical protein